LSARRTGTAPIAACEQLYERARRSRTLVWQALSGGGYRRYGPDHDRERRPRPCERQSPDRRVSCAPNTDAAKCPVRRGWSSPVIVTRR
jgi:hypothetical protein